MSERFPNVPWFVIIDDDVPVDIQVYRSPTDTAMFYGTAAVLAMKMYWLYDENFRMR